MSEPMRFCPHMQGDFVQRNVADNRVEMGKVVDTEVSRYGTVLWVQLGDGSIVLWPCDGSVKPSRPTAWAMRVGDRGTEVSELQRALAKAGFPPGDLDGEFAVATDAAVRAFQLSEGLAATGIIDRVTGSALKLSRHASDDAWPTFTVQVVASMFSSATPLGNIKHNLPLIAAAMRKQGMTTRPLALMVLATIRAETEGFAPISERPSRWNSSPNGHPFDLYDVRKDLGNSGAPDGERFRGRGFIQLTGRSNYQRIGNTLGIDLLSEPDRANHPETAAAILALFIKSREQRIEQALLHDDLRLARKLVNGGSHGLERFELAYRTGQRLTTQDASRSG